ncbi:MAG: hypothetical protein JNK82_09150, partial [Myxococcaceae bacterium]|nr:hypothetical protein [Myxococcaceae bacterium]
MPRAWLASLLLCGCANGSQVDLRFFSTPEATVRSIAVEARSGGASVGSLSYAGDGGAGIALPSSLRLIVSTSSLEIETNAYDFDGQTRHRVERLPTLAAFQEVSIDLSERGWCPAPPPEAGEQVIYGDTLATNTYVFGYSGTAPPPTSEACSGTEAREYPATRQFDGIGFALPERSPRRLTLRAWASQASQWHAAVLREDNT